MCHPRFTALLLRVPCTCDLQTTASVMPERSNTPNLALKRSAKSQFSKLLHIFPKENQHLLLALLWPPRWATCFSKRSHYFLRSNAHRQRWVMLTSRWPVWISSNSSSGTPLRRSRLLDTCWGDCHRPLAGLMGAAGEVVLPLWPSLLPSPPQTSWSRPLPIVARPCGINPWAHVERRSRPEWWLSPLIRDVLGLLPVLLRICGVFWWCLWWKLVRFRLWACPPPQRCLGPAPGAPGWTGCLHSDVSVQSLREREI